MFLGGGFLTHHFIIDDGAISNYHILTPYTMNTSSTLHRALKGLDKQLKNELIALKRMLSDIDQIELTKLLFKQVRLNRNNRFYGFVMNVCQIIIMDAKFYRNTITLNYDKERIKSTNLYQLFSYLLNQQDSSLKTHSATGILLYPTIETDYNLDFKYIKHNIQIRTQLGGIFFYCFA